MFIFNIATGQVYDYFDPVDFQTKSNIINNHESMGYSAYSHAPRSYPLRVDGIGYQHDEEIRFAKLLFKKAYEDHGIAIPENSNCALIFLVNKSGKIDKIVLGIAALKDDRQQMAKLKSTAFGLLQTFQADVSPERNYFITSSFPMPKYIVN